MNSIETVSGTDCIADVGAVRMTFRKSNHSAHASDSTPQRSGRLRQRLLSVLPVIKRNEIALCFWIPGEERTAMKMEPRSLIPSQRNVHSG